MGRYFFSIMLTAGLCCVIPPSAKAQLITFNGTGNLPVPPGAPAQTIGVTESDCAVSGIGILGGCVTIEHVTINLNHTWVGDIGILLIGPSGQVLELSTSNGGAGNNYTNTVFSDNAGPYITSGAPPYTGNFKPEGRVTNLAQPYSNTPPLGTYTFANTYNGTNADGTWTLYINDYVVADVGELISWSITFNLGGSAPVANAGSDLSICPSQTAVMIASGGGTYLWSNGETASSISVAPLITTTYTVTVSAGACGTDTDEVTVTVNQPPAVSISTSVTDICAGACATIEFNFTGIPPFTLQYNILLPGNIIFNSATFSSASNTSNIAICPPALPPNGTFQIAAISLTDANCLCQ